MQISTFSSDVAVYYAAKCNDHMEVPNFDFSIFSEAVQQEIQWLDTAVALNHGWASCHTSRKQYKKHRKDFTVVLPLLREKVHTLSMQYYFMNI